MPISDQIRVVRAAVTAARNSDPKSGNVKQPDLDRLQAAVGAIDQKNDPVAAAAAKLISDSISFDLQFDTAEVPSVLGAARALVAASGSRSAAAEGLKAARKTSELAPPTLVPTHIGLSVDLSNVTDPHATEFPATAHLDLKQPAEKKGTLAVNPDRLTIEAVKVDGKAAPFAVERGRLMFNSDGAKSVDITYKVKAQFVVSDDDFGGGTGLLVDRRDPKNVQISSLLWPYVSDQLFPSNPDPTLGVTAKVDVKTPAGFTTHSTDEKNPVPVYDLAIRSSNNMKKIAGPKTPNGTQLDWFVYGNNGTRTDAEFENALEKTSVGLQEVERILDAKYPDAKIEFQQTPGGGGGMEHQGMPYVYDGATTDKSRSANGLFFDPLHEAIHGFFGNGVRIGGWSDFTVSEGFTEYLTYRGDKKSQGTPAFKRELDQSKVWLSRALERTPTALVTPDNGDINQWFNTVPYELGAWTLRMLEAQIGTKQFDSLLGEFYREHLDEASKLSDWAQFLTDKTGKDVNGFYAKWGNATGVPTYEVSWKAKGNTVDLAFAGLAEKMPVDPNNPLLSGKVPVKLQGAKGEEKTVMVSPDSGDLLGDMRHQSIDAGFKVTKVTYDPDRTVLVNFESPTADRVGDQDVRD